MATVKVKFRKSKVKGKLGTIYYQLCHKQKTCQINPNIHIKSTQWDCHTQQVKADTRVYDKMTITHLRIKNDLQQLQHIIRNFEVTNRVYTLKDIVDTFHTPTRETTITNFFYTQISILTARRQLTTARNYYATISSFNNYIGNDQIPLTMITSDIIAGYQKWLQYKGIKRNTISFYMRNMRSVYNKAVKYGIISQSFPFNETYTGIDKTSKRAVNEHIILSIIQSNHITSNSVNFSKDIFLFSFYTCGMSFVDVAHLRHDNITNNTIIYTRRKTGQQMSIPIEPCMAEIINRYKPFTQNTPYVFPILTTTDIVTANRQYQTAIRYYNRNLKRLADMIGLSAPLSSYTPRHTWATMARNCKIPLSTISACMGHTSEKTTQIYLDSIDNTVKSNANQCILAYIESKKSHNESKCTISL